MINTEDYRQIAEHAEASGAPFEALVARYERGVPLALVLNTKNRVGIIPPDEEWLTLNQAAKLIGTSYGTLVSCSALSYAVLTSKSASARGNGCRGAGRLILKSDAKELGRIKRVVGVSLTAACKIMRAKQEGTL